MSFLIHRGQKPYKFQFHINVFGITQLPLSVAPSSRIYISWKRGSKLAGKTHPVPVASNRSVEWRDEILVFKSTCYQQAKTLEFDKKKMTFQIFEMQDAKRTLKALSKDIELDLARFVSPDGSPRDGRFDLIGKVGSSTVIIKLSISSELIVQATSATATLSSSKSLPAIPLSKGTTSGASRSNSLQHTPGAPDDFMESLLSVHFDTTPLPPPAEKPVDAAAEPPLSLSAVVAAQLQALNLSPPLSPPRVAAQADAVSELPDLDQARLSVEQDSLRESLTKSRSATTLEMTDHGQSAVSTAADMTPPPSRSVTPQVPQDAHSSVGSVQHGGTQSAVAVVSTSSPSSVKSALTSSASTAATATATALSVMTTRSSAVSTNVSSSVATRARASTMSTVSAAAPVLSTTVQSTAVTAKQPSSATPTQVTTVVSAVLPVSVSEKQVAAPTQSQPQHRVSVDSTLPSRPVRRPNSNHMMRTVDSDAFSEISQTNTLGATSLGGQQQVQAEFMWLAANLEQELQDLRADVELLRMGGRRDAEAAILRSAIQQWCEPLPRHPTKQSRAQSVFDADHSEGTAYLRCGTVLPVPTPACFLVRSLSHWQCVEEANLVYLADICDALLYRVKSAKDLAHRLYWLLITAHLEAWLSHAYRSEIVYGYDEPRQASPQGAKRGQTPNEFNTSDIESDEEASSAQITCSGCQRNTFDDGSGIALCSDCKMRFTPNLSQTATSPELAYVTSTAVTDESISQVDLQTGESAALPDGSVLAKAALPKPPTASTLLGRFLNSLEESMNSTGPAPLPVPDNAGIRGTCLWFQEQINQALQASNRIVCKSIFAQLAPVLGPVFLSLPYEDLSDCEDDDSLRKLPSSEPTIDYVISVLNHTLVTCHRIYLPDVVIQQLFLQIFYQIDVALFNALARMLNHCKCVVGLKLKFQLTALVQWAKSQHNNSAVPFLGACVQQLQHILQVADLLCMNKLSAAATEIRTVVCPSLNTFQLLHFLSIYTPDEEFPETLPEDLVQKLQESSISETTAKRFMQLMLDPEFVCPFTVDGLQSSYTYAPPVQARYSGPPDDAAALFSSAAHVNERDLLYVWLCAPLPVSVALRQRTELAFLMNGSE